jgi:hypothetical protein
MAILTPSAPSRTASWCAAPSVVVALRTAARRLGDLQPRGDREQSRDRGGGVEVGSNLRRFDR